LRKQGNSLAEFSLLPTLIKDKAIARAQELEAKIQNFCQKNEIE
jgi:hypothetical protein